MTHSPRRSPEEIAQDVVASFESCENERLRELMQTLTAHLHAFTREVRLTRDEWTHAMAVLAETGRITDQDRQEFILWSDALGLSMAVDAVADNRDPRATESTVEGPFWAPDAPEREAGASISERPGGVPLLMHGQVSNVEGQPIAGAEIDVWQNGPDRLYAVQDPSAPHDHLRGKFRTGRDGTYSLLAVRPTPYPIPEDGPVGAMLRATGRSSWRPAHMHVAVSAPGFQTLVTHIFDAHSEFLDRDAVFAVKPSLVKWFVQRDATDPTRPHGVDEEWFSVKVDFVLDFLPADDRAPRLTQAGGS
jgi:protocatechuate 3,4-dioxygenase beta subunit